MSARLAKAAVAALGANDAQEIELIWPGLAPPYVELFAWLEGRAEKPASGDPAPFRPPMLAHALDEPDLAGLDAAEFMAEWKWDGIRVQAVAAPARRRHDRAALFAHRRGYFQELSRSPRRAASAGRHRRRTSDRARPPRAVVQRAAAAAQSQNRHAETAWPNFPRICAPTICSPTATRICASCRLPSAARGSKHFVTRLDDPRVDLSPLVAFRELGGTDGRAQESGGSRCRRRCRRGRGRHAQAARCAVPARPAERPVVEMEARPVHHRRGADVCPARPRQALLLLFRLHVRRLDAWRRRRRAGAGRQSLFRLHRRGAVADRPLRPPQHYRPVRPGARSRA